MESTNSIPQELGDFEIIRELGRGGMGIVYEARQKSLNRRVALKVLSSGLGLTAKAVMRFRREAEAAAKLHHTNIVPIYSTGEDRGVHYYAMELIDGPSLDQVIRHMREVGEPESTVNDTEESDVSESSEHLPDWVDETIAFEGQTPPTSSQSISTKAASLSGSTVASGTKYFDTVATMIADVADALDHAHDHGVIHRDIKPSNLLLGPDGRLSINDFGLARVLEQPGMTMSGEFVGSPLYMSPEQITAGRAPLDHRTDIYSLGATLYELLTLRPPFPGKTRDEVIAQILHKEPMWPRAINRKIPKDLETICLKAIEQDPDRRYQTADALATDLQSYVNRCAISARRVSLPNRLVKWAKRKPALALMAGLTIVAAVVVAILAAKIQRDQAHLRLQALEAAQNQAVVYAFGGQFSEAEQEYEKARGLGASVGWLRRLRGQIALHRGHHAEAVEHLAAAYAEEADVTSLAMLAVARFWSGDEVAHYEELSRLDNINANAESDVQRLFVAHAWAWSNPLKARTILDSVAEGQNLGIGLLISCAVHEQLCLRGPNELYANGETERIREFLRVAQAANTVMPDNPMATYHCAIANLLAAGASDDDSKKHEQLATVDRLTLQLSERLPALWYSRTARFYFLDQIGDHNAAIENSVLPPLENEVSYVSFLRVIGYYRQNDLEAALLAFDRAVTRPRDNSRFFRFYVELDQVVRDEARRQALLEEVELQARDSPSLYFEFYWPLLRLLEPSRGTSSLVYAKEIAATTSNHPWRITCLDFALGLASAEDTIAAAQGARWDTTYAHLIVGLDALADGDRASASEHFDSALDTKCFETYGYWLARAFRERIENAEWLPHLETVALANETEMQIGAGEAFDSSSE